MEGSYKKMRTNDNVIGQGAYSAMGYSNYNSNNTNTSYYGHSTGYINTGYNNNNNNNRGRGGRNNNSNRGRGGRSHTGGRGRGNSSGRYGGSSTFFKPTMLLDPWQDIVEDMIMNKQLPER